MTWDALACCHFVDEGWGILHEMWSITTNSISPTVSVQGLIKQEGGNSVHDRVCKRKVCVVLDWNSENAMSFQHSLFFWGRREAQLDLPLLTSNSKAWVSHTLHRWQGQKQEEYLLAFPHLKIGLHKQFLTWFQLHWSILLTKLGKNKSIFFSSSRIIRNSSLVTDPFLVGDLISLILYLWHIPSMHHVNSSTQECLELGICYLFLVSWL